MGDAIRAISLSDVITQWVLTRNDEVLANAERAATRADRRRGLLGRDGVDGVIVLDPARQVHTFRMRFVIDVIWCDSDGIVLRTVTMAPNRMSALVWHARSVLEAEAGVVARWELQAGDRLEVRPRSF